MPLSLATSTIVASAFRHMELSPISSFADDSEEAQATTEQYPSAMAECLEASDWSFASRLSFLPPATLPLTVAADPDLPYSYTLPADLVRIQEVGDSFTAWRRDKEVLRADHPGPLRIRYTAMITDEGTLPATFRDAVALRLAILLAPRWLTTSTKMDRLEMLRRQAIQMAMRHDGRSASSSRWEDGDSSDWVAEARA